MAKVQKKLNDPAIDKEKKKRFDSQMNEFEKQFSDVEEGNKDPLEVDDRVSAAEDNIDETITTLQSEREKLKEDFQNTKNQIGEDNLEEFFKEFPYFKQLFDNVIHLQETDKKISDWRAYQYGMCDGSRNMLYNKILDYKDDEVDIKAAKRLKEQVDGKVDNIKDVLETILENHHSDVQQRIESEVGSHMSEQNVKIATMEKDIEFLEERTFNLLQEMSSTVSKTADTVDDDSIEGELREIVDEINQASDEVKDREERMKGKKDRLDLSVDDDESEDEDDDSSDDDENNDEDEDDDINGQVVKDKEAPPEIKKNRPSFELQYKSWSEMKETFAEMEDAVPDKHKNIDDLAKYVENVNQDAIKQKLEGTRQKFDDEDILPSVDLNE